MLGLLWDGRVPADESHDPVQRQVRFRFLPSTTILLFGPQSKVNVEQRLKESNYTSFEPFRLK